MLFFVTKSVFYGSFVTQISSGIAGLKVITMVLDIVQLVNYFFSTGQINGGFLPTANIL